MLISTLNLEAKALKAFREDPETDSDLEDLDYNQNSQAPKTKSRQEIELGRFNSGAVSDSNIED